MDPDPSHVSPTALPGQTNTPPREWASSSVGYEHVDGGSRPQTYSSDNPLDSSSEPPHDNIPIRGVSRDPKFPNPAQLRGGYRPRTTHSLGYHLDESMVPFVTDKPHVQSDVPDKKNRVRSDVPDKKNRSYWPFMQKEVPVEVIIEPSKRGTFRVRIQETIRAAEHERDETLSRVKRNTWLLNIAIVLQVIFGALTTGLSATLSAKQIGVVIPVLGGMSTAVAAYVAQARGSGEPDISKAHLKKMNQFLRECRAFTDDHGDKGLKEVDVSLNDRVNELRKRFEALLGNTDGQGKAASRKLVDSDEDTEEK